MALSTENIVRISQIEGVSHKGIQDLSDRILLPYDNQKDLVELILKNREELGIHDIARNKLDEVFNRADFLLNKSIRMGIQTFSKSDSIYPDLLRSVPNAPLLLHAKGNIGHLNDGKLSIGVIGTRQPSNLGKETARLIGEVLSRDDINIVSRLSPGIDAAALRGALKWGEGATAFLAQGLDLKTTSENKKLAGEILDGNGLLLSDRWVGTGPNPTSYADRNIALVGSTSRLALVESDAKEGAIQAAHKAMELGRPLGVYKHMFPFMTGKSAGNSLLLGKEGVTVIKSLRDAHDFSIKSFTDTRFDKGLRV